MSWCRRCCVNSGYDREIILEFVEILIGIRERMIQRVQKRGIMRAK